MSEYRLNKPPELRRRLSLPFITGSAIMILVMLALPVTQMVTGSPEKPLLDTTITPYTPPELQAPDKPEPPEPDDPTIDKFKEDLKPPSIDELVIMNDPDLTSYGNGDYTMPVHIFGDSIGEIIHTIDQLTRVPRPVRQTKPVYPHELKAAGISGSVVLTFIVRADGTTSRVKVESSTNPGFEQPAIKSARRWLFEPGEKDGKAVNTIVRIQIPFTVDRGL